MWEFEFPETGAKVMPPAQGRAAKNKEFKHKGLKVDAGDLNEVLFLAAFIDLADKGLVEWPSDTVWSPSRKAARYDNVPIGTIKEARELVAALLLHHKQCVTAV